MTVARARAGVLAGMGLVVLRSGHLAKAFTSLMETSCNPLARGDDRELIWTVNPSYPIAEVPPIEFENTSTMA